MMNNRFVGLSLGKHFLRILLPFLMVITLLAPPKAAFGDTTPCTWTTSPSAISQAKDSGTGSITLSASATSCTWNASSDQPWLNLATSSGTGGGSLVYSVSVNTGTTPRTATITVSGQVVTVTQAATSGSATTIDFVPLSAWTVYGTASSQGGALTIGDNIGYDISDSDNDGNPYNVWYSGSATAGQGVDYDIVVSNQSFSPPLTILMSGCIPTTNNGYHNVFFGRQNTAFTGTPNSKQYPITQEFGFTTSWEKPGLNTAVLSASGTLDQLSISGASVSSGGYCGDFRIDWANGTLDFYYNGSKVRSQSYAYQGSMRVVVHSFDKPYSMTSFRVAATSGSATTTDLVPLNAWTVYGTASSQEGTLTLGDNIGYDTSDSDRDGNPYNAWYSGSATAAQGVDYDVAVSNRSFLPPLTISMSGCIPTTSHGYHNLLFGHQNTAFTGEAGSAQYPIAQEFGFTTSWEKPGLNTAVLSAGGTLDQLAISGAFLSSGGYCGDFRIDWANGTLDFYYNGSKVKSQSYAYKGPVRAVLHSFDKPYSITSFRVAATGSEISGNRVTVQKIFIGYYHRPADPGGLIYWAERLDATGGNLNEIIEAFANSAESQTFYGTINSSNISNVVNNIYLALFNRDADPGGLNYYVDGFNMGRFTVATIMLNILNGAINEDLQSVNNKVTAANLFTMTIDPDLDGSNFQVTYAGDADVIAARNFLTLYATSEKVPTQAETTAYVRANIANPGDAIWTQ